MDFNLSSLMLVTINVLLAIKLQITSYKSQVTNHKLLIVIYSDISIDELTEKYNVRSEETVWGNKIYAFESLKTTQTEIDSYIVTLNSLSKGILH